MLWILTAGFLAGIAMGYLGAGSNIIGIPFLLYLVALQPHIALGTNALGVSFIAFCILLWRLRNGEVPVREGLIFALPGIAGSYVGAQVGLLYPGQKLIFLLGILLFVIAAWLFYSSKQLQKQYQSNDNGINEKKQEKLLLMIICALGAGLVAGFFGIGGGFMIVPILLLTSKLNFKKAVAASLIPITVFSAWIGLQYWHAGAVNVTDSLWMLVPGVIGGLLGIQLGFRVPNVRSQQVLALLMILLGVYICF